MQKTASNHIEPKNPLPERVLKRGHKIVALTVQNSNHLNTDLFNDQFGGDKVMFRFLNPSLHEVQKYRW